MNGKQERSVPLFVANSLRPFRSAANTRALRVETLLETVMPTVDGPRLISCGTSSSILRVYAVQRQVRLLDMLGPFAEHALATNVEILVNQDA